MSRAAKSPVIVPAGVEITLSGQELIVKGSKGVLKLLVHQAVSVVIDGDKVSFAPKDEASSADAFVGTMKALSKNMVEGVSKGFEKKLLLKGVGYKAQVQGAVLLLNLGFSHPVKFAIPAGVNIETPTPTDVVIKGIDRHLVGQVAANIRAYRSPEPYKGKGVRYHDEVVVLKEGKKK